MSTTPMQTVLPRWRGFNLDDFFTMHSDGNVAESDFRWIADWGFDFVRLPMCYTLWTGEDNVYRIDELFLEKIDRAVLLGQQYGIHVCLNFHRAPGYSVNPERTEPVNLWKDEVALEAFCYHWQLFANRYRRVGPDRLSLNLVNEPPAPTSRSMTREDHARVMRTAVQVIRDIDPYRPIILDGLRWGNDPCPELGNLDVAQSCRAYIPMGVSHYKASWVGGELFPSPAWPGGWHNGAWWDRAMLEQHYKRWADLAAQGVGVHCGEGGAFLHTPHDIVLRWFRDVLEIDGCNIGWALWNFRGAFGILDSGRPDVQYVNWHGHQLDREFLQLLQAF